MSRLAQDIILRPIITENSMDGIADRKYTFEVAKDANKIEIAKAVVAQLSESDTISEVTAVMPGFINIKVDNEFLAAYLQEMTEQESYGFEKAKNPLTIIVDYGGPNVAKPLHIGHLRSAIIGESLKRIVRFMGHNVTGDVHLGDWGLQMGLIITELKLRKPDLVYFDENYTGEVDIDFANLDKDSLLNLLAQ